MSAPSAHMFLCNGASPLGTPPCNAKVECLDYEKQKAGRNVNLLLPDFVQSVYHLPDRVLDLLEIAAYIFAADRSVSRGSREAVEYHSWARDMHFTIKVRDHDFWEHKAVQEKLISALLFMTGDGSYHFDFIPGHSTPPTSLFDSEAFSIQRDGPICVALFSGGLDSLAGVLQRLKTMDESLCLVSHQSGLPSTKRTQKKLIDALKREYGSRISHYRFGCGLTGVRSSDENQRTRAFLFTSIAYALAHCLGVSEVHAYENGITSLNLLRRQDLINSRASRTTHPKTLSLMSDFLSQVHSDPFSVVNPFSLHTKADVFGIADQCGGRDLITSTVSCSTTYNRSQNTTHCGECFQCVDRRLAAYAADMDEVDDAGIYASDIFTAPVSREEARMTVIDYIRQADDFSKKTDDAFYVDYAAELAEIVGYLDIKDESDAVSRLWELCKRHGSQVMTQALVRIREKHDDLGKPVVERSLLDMIGEREHLKTDPERLAQRIAKHLQRGIPLAFQTHTPSGENELNDQIQALLSTEEERYHREFPSTMFTLAKAVPDHSHPTVDLVIEAKFLRSKTTPSKASEAIAADITKYSKSHFILFVIYDPGRSIADDQVFRGEIESKRRCHVAIIR